MGILPKDRKNKENLKKKYPVFPYVSVVFPADACYNNQDCSNLSAPFPQRKEQTM